MSLPILNTDRLLLRQMETSDDEEIYFLRSDPGILKYLDIPVAVSIDDARKFIQKINTGIENDGLLYWAISLKNEKKLIGTICIWNVSEDKTKADIGYVLHPDFQGKGLMQEAVKKIIEFGFDSMGFQSLDADVEPGNSKSIQLLVKIGFELTKQSDKTVIYSLAKQK